MSPAISTAPIRCDSCGELASPEHIHDRILRLERSTRYRPIHIWLLLICTAAPARAEDDLYAIEMEQGSFESRAYISGLLACVGIAAPSYATPAAQLAELQHRGIYLARIVECPLAKGATDANIAARYANTLLTRIAFSYKPKRIALLDPLAPGLAELLVKSAIGAQLVAKGQGIEVPAATDAPSVARVQALLQEPAS